MSLRPAVVVTGSLLGATALALTAAPAQAAPAQAAAGTQAESPWDAPTTVAHRGASAYAPENTLAAADKARELGIKWVENDVQRTKDGELVVMHDATLNRTTNAEELFPGRAPWKVADFTYKEISQLDAGSWFDEEYAGEPVPTLKQFLNRMSANHQKLLLEIKNPDLYPGIEADILKELSNEGWLRPYHVRSKLIIQSFGAESVKTVHDLAPAVKTGFLGTPDVNELPDYAAFADQINPRYTDLTPEYIAAIHSLTGPRGRPLEVFTWTVDDAPTAVRLADMGVDGIISNRPDVIRDATRKAAWLDRVGG